MDGIPSEVSDNRLLPPDHRPSKQGQRIKHTVQRPVIW